jgi:putative phosphoesterase
MIGFFSDIHGNLEAARRGIEILTEKGAQEFVFLGDSVGYGSDAGVVEYLRNFPRPLACLKGNHDNMLLTSGWPKENDDIYQLSRMQKNLTTNDLAFMSQWNTSLTYQTPHGAALIVHGGPQNHLEQYVYPDDPLPDVSEEIRYIFMGHTHWPFIRKCGSQTFVNVGSCGLPRDIGNLGCVCLFDFDEPHIEILRYDISDINQRMVAAGELHETVIDLFNRKDTKYIGILQR